MPGGKSICYKTPVPTSYISSKESQETVRDKPHRYGLGSWLHIRKRYHDIIIQHLLSSIKRGILSDALLFEGLADGSSRMHHVRWQDAEFRMPETWIPGA